jgi:hypothetical protein
MDYQNYIENYKKSIQDNDTEKFLTYLNEDIVPPFYFIMSSNAGYGITYSSFNSIMLNAMFKKYPFLSDNMSFNDALMKAYLKENKTKEFELLINQYSNDNKPEKLKEKLQYTIPYLDAPALEVLTHYLPKSSLSYNINLLSRSINESTLSLDKVKALILQTEIKTVSYDQLKELFEMSFKQNNEHIILYFKEFFSKFLNKKTRQGSPYITPIDENIALTNWELLVSEFYLKKIEPYYKGEISDEFYENEVPKEKIKLTLSLVLASKIYKYNKTHPQFEKLTELFNHKYYRFDLFDFLVNPTKATKEKFLNNITIEEKEILNHSYL